LGVVLLAAGFVTAGCAGSDTQSQARSPHEQEAREAGVVPTAANESKDAASQLNKAIVGKETQRRNEAIAEAPRPETPYEKKEREKREKERGRAEMQPPGAIETVTRDVTRATDAPGRYVPFSVEFNPLGLMVGGRLSFNAEWAPVTHHALIGSTYIIHTSNDVAVTGDLTESQTFTGVGGELGYRYYTGRRGMNGVFIGPSLIGGAFNAGLPRGNQAFTNAGLAVDVGAQQIFADHIVVGGGVGVEYITVSHDFHDLPTGPSAIATTGLKPRLLLSAGYGF
jgi:hypothetical protein